MSGGRLVGPAIRAYVLAGNATFTVVNPRTTARFTFRVRASRDGKVHFVSVLNGADNASAYTYLGFIRDGAYRHGGQKARIGATAPSARAFAWFWDHVGNPLPAEVLHEGRCGRCGRVLTVPESIESGLGPECAGRMNRDDVDREYERASRTEREMQRMEADGDREQTAREEAHRWTSDMFREWELERAANAGAAQ